MKHLTTLAVFFVVTLLGCSNTSESVSISELFDRVEHHAGAKPRTEKGRVFIEGLKSKEGEAAPHLIKALSHSDIGVAAMAAAALGELEQIDVKYFDEVVVGLDRGISWLPRALAIIQDDKAAKESVERYLSSPSSPHNQDGYAVRVQDLRAVPFIIDAAVSNNGTDSRVYYLLSEALDEMSQDARYHAAQLLKPIIENETKNTLLLTGVLRIISSLGKDGIGLEDTLISLAEKNPNLNENVNQSLVGIKSKLSGRIFSDKLETKLNELEDNQSLSPKNPLDAIRGSKFEVIALLNQICISGNSSQEVGPIVLNLLHHSDWEIRRKAAVTLGYMEYSESVPQLTLLLGDDSDVLINRIAAFSLGRIQDETALNPLKETALHHWHPAVRSAAEKAIQILRVNEYLSADEIDKILRLGLGGYAYFGLDSAPLDDSSKTQISSESKLYRSSASSQIRELSYKTDRIGFTANNEAEQLEKKGKGAIIEVNQSNIMAVKTEIDVVPNVARRVSDGWIVGSNRGEWGGELLYIDSDKNKHLILKENVHDIHQLKNKLIAITGLAHLTLNNGMVWVLEQNEESIWTAKKWRALPGAPIWSKNTDSGEVIISTVGGGNIILSCEGDFRMFTN